ncbi:uncharacterized protein LOC132791868 [Drosophila nasuta]|uniref:uncharacterized protein LOC132791868 n=1 Tax=Drosophila nasuta TaxID=42062 RepID=UPI00295E99E9|nr:uncharacterized protein LOC132791868 [Drosophila nasuta]
MQRGIKDATNATTAHRSQTTAMPSATGTFGLILLLSGVLLGIEGLPTADVVTHAPPDNSIVEARAHKEDQDALDVDDDLDGRSAYVNNQFVPNEPVELLDDEQNAPLYEILQKQMEQVLAATGPDVPIYADDKTKRQRLQQPPNKPLFTSNNEAEADDDYVDETVPESEQGDIDAEKPDAAATAEEQLPETNYQVQQQPIPTSKPASSSSSTRRPQRRRTTTALPRTTRSKTEQQSKVTSTTVSPELTSSTTAAPASTSASNQKQRPHSKPNPNLNNSLPHDPQIYQHKRRIIFKTISTGSQFVNSPIGDLMIKFSIGFAKPAGQATATPSSEMLRAFSNNLLRNIELQKLKRVKVQKD